MIKRITTLVFALLTIVGNAVWGQNVWDGSIATGFAGGSGIETDPYQISNGAELAYLAKLVNEKNQEYNAAYYILTSDITLNAGSCEEWGTNAPQNEWTPIGTFINVSRTNSFQGALDGNGKTISGIYIDNKDNTTSSALGLFGALYTTNTNPRKIKNLKVINSYIEGGTNDIYIGGIVGFGNEYYTISNCSFDGVIKAAYDGTSQTTCVGGIWGSSYSGGGVIEYCYNNADITVSLENISTDYTSHTITGIGAANSVSHSYNTGDIKVTASNINAMMISVSGITHNPFNVSSCYNTGDITVSGDNNTVLVGVGGILGCAAQNKVEYCYNSGEINTNLTDLQCPEYFENALGIGSIIGLITDTHGELNCIRNYYLHEGTENTLSAIGGNASEADKEYVFTEEENAGKNQDAFINGEVAYLLKDGGYGQDLGNVYTIPGLTAFEEYAGKEVYQVVFTQDGETKTIRANKGTIKILSDEEYAALNLGEKSLIGKTADGRVMSLGQTIDLDTDLELTLEETEESYYAITVNPAEGITITPDRKFAKENETVSITVIEENDEIYTFNGISVIGSTDDDIEVEENGENSYKFTMPNSAVAINAMIVAEAGQHSISTMAYYGFVAGAALTASPQYAKAGEKITLSLKLPDMIHTHKVKYFETEGLDPYDITEINKWETPYHAYIDQLEYTYEFIMPNNDVEIKAFVEKDMISIDFETDGNGTLEVITKTAYGEDEIASIQQSDVEAIKNKIFAMALKEESITLRIYPNEGYEVDVISLKDGAGNPIVVSGENNIYTFITPNQEYYSNVIGTITFKEITSEEPEQPGGDDDDENQSDTGIHKPQRPIKYYNIYVDTICPGLNVEVSKDVVQEGHQVSAYLTIQAECDTTGMRFEYKRGLFGYWQDLKALEGVQPGEYIIKNIYTDIYIRALDATLPEEEPTGIEDLEGIKAYAKDGSIYVYTLNREEVMIIGMTGAIIKNEEQVGLQSYSVSRGIYIVRIGEKVFKLKN